MRYVRIVAALLTILPQLVFSQAANHVVISEVAPMGGASTLFNTGEYVELYNPLSVDVTFGPNHQVVSGATPAGTNAAEWQVSLAGKTIKAYGFFLIGDGGVANADLAFPASRNLSNSGIRSCVQLRDGATVIDAFGWDPALAPTLSAEGTSFSPSTTSSDKKSFERKSAPLATAHTTTGNAWDSNNNSSDFFENNLTQANPQNSGSPIAVNPYGVGSPGSGSAYLAPAIWKYNHPTTIRVVFRAFPDTVRALKIVKPSVFTWNAANISVSPATISSFPLGDTVTFSNFVLSGLDSVVLTITSVRSADSTDEFGFAIRSSKNGIAFGSLPTQPTTLVYGSPRPISTLKRKESNGIHSLFGKWAVARGIVTVANEFGGPSYLQDATAGMAVFDSSVSQNVERGDDVILLGKVAPFNELFEFAPCTLLEVVAEGLPLDTTVVTIRQVKSQIINDVEAYEAKLIRINNVASIGTISGQPNTPWTVNPLPNTGNNYRLISGTDTLEVRISIRTNIANTVALSGKFDLIGVLGQFNSTYQIQPRSLDDIILEGTGPRLLSQPPFESSITSSSLRFSWQTDMPSTTIVRYGKTTAYGTEVTDTNKVTQHSFTVIGLSPATIYNVQLASTNADGTTTSPNAIVSTSSKTSTGVINVYFNKSVNTTLARTDTARTVSLLSKALDRINAAKSSIDCALYSLSGSVGSSIANALTVAKNRGVKVRMIVEKDNLTAGTGTTFTTIITPAGIPWIADNFDGVNNGAGLHHNKFFVFDNRDTTSDTDDWVMTGSWNPTDTGTNGDWQNAIEIQDQALANAYTTEFNEMWGGSSDTSNATTSRFGARKLDNTPHLFIVGSVPVECYFSPSDRTTSQIIRTLAKAQHSINMCLLLLTRSDIAVTLKARKDAGVKIRGVLDGSSVDAFSQYNYLIANGMDFRLENNLDLLHHKYAIINAENSSLTQYVITGSHNWSSSAENSNNENTLIIQSNRIANLYLQEFAARYKDNGGTDDIVVSVEKQGSAIPNEYTLGQNYPNPFNPVTSFEFRVASSGFVRLKVYDILGRQVATLVDEEKPAGVYHVSWNGSGMASGVYLYQLKAGAFFQTRKMILLR
jgi:phosphatidylserine/phosphatidylglycerophosphate/cardiolipin synthase-like enzyme